MTLMNEADCMRREQNVDKTIYCSRFPRLSPLLKTSIRSPLIGKDVRAFTIPAVFGKRIGTPAVVDTDAKTSA